jgi:multiple sugar transport system permease protein
MATATSAPPAPPREGMLRRLGRSEHAVGWAFVSPAALIIGIFGLLPILWSLLLSFQKSDLLTPQTPWVGLQNYKQIPGDATFRLAIEHTIVYTALFVPCTMLVGLVIAAALNRKVRGISIYRTAAYVTMAVSTINEALYVIVAMTVWGWTGFAVVIYLAALQGVPQELQDAAAIDGAKRFTIFRTITFPLLSPASLFLVVWLSINALQLFDEVYLTTRGGPLYSTTVVVYYLYDQAFQQFNAGYAAALAYVLFLVIIVITFIQFRVGNRFVHYNR